MDTIGVHFISELSGCDEQLLGNPQVIDVLLQEAVTATGLSMLQKHVHVLPGSGVSGLAFLSESHLSIHTWPERGYAAIDVYTCGRGYSAVTVDIFAERLKARSVSTRILQRGIEQAPGFYASQQMSQDCAATSIPATWFCDASSGSQSHAYLVKRLLARRQTQFQDVAIVDTAGFGRALFVDGVVQSTERDEHIYHEALVHPGLLNHRNPSRILVIGGGEGAVLREVLRHRSVQQVDMVDIDGELVTLCKRLLPEWAAGAFEDPRVQIHVADGKSWLESSTDLFDVVLMDLTDQISLGPSFPLYTRSFYRTVYDHLSPRGLVVVQAGELSAADYFSHCSIRRSLATVFPVVASYSQGIPSFFAQWSWVIASRDDQPFLDASEIDHAIEASLISLPRFFSGGAHAKMWSHSKDVVEAFERSGVIVTTPDAFVDEMHRQQLT